jgi:hypothetical protein
MEVGGEGQRDFDQRNRDAHRVARSLRVRSSPARPAITLAEGEAFQPHLAHMELSHTI